MGIQIVKAIPTIQSHTRSRRGFVNRTARQCITAVLAVALVACAVPIRAQSPGTLLPNVPGMFLDNAGNPCSGCKLYTYAAGTTTPLSTYSDSALLTSNANPTILDSAGRATIYLTPTNYKVILKSAADATIWTRDNVAAIPYTTLATAFNSICDVRLSLTTALGVTSADVTAAVTIYVTPYLGNRCAFYSGAQWTVAAVPEQSQSIAFTTANTNYDVFMYLLADGTPTIESTAWSSDTTRAVALSKVDGVLVKSNDTTRRYIGTYRTTGVAGQTEDSFAKRFVWNMNHRVRRGLRIVEATATWNYSTNTFRQARASTANQVAVVVGVAEALLSLSVAGSAIDSVGVAAGAVSIGEDSTTTPMGGILMQTQTFDNTHRGIPNAKVERYPAVGYHFYAWLETVPVTGGTVTWDGTAGTTYIQTGLIGSIEG